MEPYTQEQHLRQPRPTQASQTKNVHSQNPVSIHSYQPTQKRNEIPLPYYLQQHEITKSQLTIFFTNSKCRRITSNDYESIPNG